MLLLIFLMEIQQILGELQRQGLGEIRLKLRKILVRDGGRLLEVLVKIFFWNFLKLKKIPLIDNTLKILNSLNSGLNLSLQSSTTSNTQSSTTTNNNKTLNIQNVRNNNNSMMLSVKEEVKENRLFQKKI